MINKEKKIEYVLMNPSDNYTILVLSEVPVSEHEEIAKQLLICEPLAEQVGFLIFGKDDELFIRMAGGEFCGNATMSAAVYYYIKKDILKKDVVVNFYGIDMPLKVQVEKNDNEVWEGTVEMPSAKEIKNVTFEDNETLPVVFLDNIAHVVMDKNYSKNFTKEIAEKKIKEWCGYLKVPALGIMNYDFEKSELKPLVYVEKIDTLYWENSCASGTAATAYYLDSKSVKPINIKVKQSGGKILEAFTTRDNKLFLKGKVELVYEKSITI